LTIIIRFTYQKWTFWRAGFFSAN